jgi:diphthine-ammonia ligase
MKPGLLLLVTRTSQLHSLLSECRVYCSLRLTLLKVAVLATSGKDSALALHRVLAMGWKVDFLVTMVPWRPDSWMFHYPSIHMVDLFAEAAGIPLLKAETSGVKEAEVEDLKRVLTGLDVDAVVSGAIASQYQKDRVDRICQELGKKHVAPLWHEEPLGLLKEIVALKMEVVFVGVYAHGFDPTWLGRRIDEKVIGDLVELNRVFQVSLVGEGGEYETLVLDAPFFRKRIDLVETERIWEKTSGYLDVRKAVLVDKGEKG